MLTLLAAGMLAQGRMTEAPGALDILDATPQPSALVARNLFEQRRVLSRIELSMQRLSQFPNSAIEQALITIDQRLRRRWKSGGTLIEKQVAALYPRVGGENASEYQDRIGIELEDDEMKEVLVTRFLFQLPASEDWNLTPFSHLLEQAASNGRVDLLFPFKREADARTELATTVKWDAGLGFDPIEEFKFYSSRYKRRGKWW